jgi:hypothetical protein
VLDGEALTEASAEDLEIRNDDEEQAETDAGFHSEGGEGTVRGGPGGLVVGDAETGEGESARTLEKEEKKERKEGEWRKEGETYANPPIVRAKLIRALTSPWRVGKQLLR